MTLLTYIASKRAVAVPTMLFLSAQLCFVLSLDTTFTTRLLLPVCLANLRQQPSLTPDTVGPLRNKSNSVPPPATTIAKQL